MHISRYWDGTGEPGISSEGDGFDNRTLLLRAPANDDNLAVTLADATVAQLLLAVRGKIDSQPPNLRRLMNQLVRSRLVSLLGEGRP